MSGMRVIGLAGWSGAGKTSLLVRAIPVLVARGVKVATIKHAHHDFDTDWPGKDSYEHRKAGASEVLSLFGPPVGTGPRAARRAGGDPGSAPAADQPLRPRRRGRVQAGADPQNRGPSRRQRPPAPLSFGPHHRGHRERRRISGIGHSHRRSERCGGGDGADARRSRSLRRCPREALAGWPSSAMTASRSAVL